MSSPRPRVCIISPEIVGPFKNGGIGTHCFYLAEFLSRKLEHDVTFLYTGKIEVQTDAYWQDWFRRELGINFVCLPAASDSAPSTAGPPCYDTRVAQKVYEWLRPQTFDVCFFQEMLGHGFRCFQAKRLGIAFQKTLLTCMLHSSWEWICQAMQMFPSFGCSELQTKFTERYCSEHCDFLISPSEYMFSWAARNGVRLPERRAILPYLFDSKIQAVGYRPTQQKLIFFGRLEVRKGLLLFLEALLHLDRQKAFSRNPVHVTFLGKPGHTPDGGALASIAKFQAVYGKGIKIETVTELGHHQAIEYLTTHNDALVVCPSLVDNSPFAVIESLQLGFNLIAANTGGIPELFGDQSRLFEPDPVSLAEKIQAGLDNRLPPLTKSYSVAKSARLWQDFCEKVLSQPVNAAALPKPARSDKVRVLLNANQSAQGLERALKCLAQQTHKNIAVSVIHEKTANGSSAAFERARAKFDRPDWTFMELQSGQALPRENDDGFTLLLGRGSFLYPEALSKVVSSMQSSGLDILSCGADVVMDGDDTSSNPTHVFEPLGACLEVGVFANVLGCGCVLVRNELAPRTAEETFRCLGHTSVWPFLVEQVVAGRQCDAYPEAVFLLQADEEAFVQGNGNYLSHFGVLRAYSRNLPDWVNRVLLVAVASDQSAAHLEYRITQMECERKMASQYNLGTFLFKMNRERRRIKNQIKSLARRLTGTTAHTKPRVNSH